MRRSYPSSSSSHSPSPSSPSLPTLGTPANTPQPAPVGSGKPVVDAVLADVESRRDFGLRKYGTLLRTYNGRDALWDLYQELLDAVMYLRQFHLEKGTEPTSTSTAVAEGKWSPVYSADRVLVGHVTFIEGSLYWRPVSGRITSSEEGTAVTTQDAPQAATTEMEVESYQHRSG